MKKLLSIMTIIILVFVFSACNNTNTKTTNDNNHSKTATSNEDTNISTEYKIFSSYSDAARNFNELKDTSSFVVRGYVLSANQKSKFAQEATIKVTGTYKGKTSTEITLYQNLGDNLVEKDNEYILFLNEQEPENPNSQIYYPVGGGIGVLKIDESAKEIFTSDDRIIDSDMKAWVNNNLTSTRSSDEYKILVNPD